MAARCRLREENVMRRSAIAIPIALALFAGTLVAPSASAMTTDLPDSAVCGALILNGRVIGWMCIQNGERWQCTGYRTGCTLDVQVIRTPIGQRLQVQRQPNAVVAQQSR
jgi:hypothetical protein